MMDRRNTNSGYEGLLRVIRQVRRRWRIKRGLQALAILVAAIAVTVVLAVVAVERLAPDSGGLVAARIVILLTAFGLAARLLLPLGKRVSDDDVALYLEEHEPSLRAALITALTSGSADSGISPAFARRTIETALERCRQVQFGERIERRNLARSAGAITGVAAAAVALYLIAPPGFQRAARSLFLPHAPAEAAVPSLVLVEPGNVNLPRGADLEVTATLSGFQSREAVLVTRANGDSTLLRVPMLPREEGEGFELRLFSLDRALDYYVEADGIRSPAFRADVLEVPYVQRLEVELNFPEYTGLEPRLIEEGGDIAAPAGTVVRLRAFPTLPVQGGEARLSDGRVVPLTVDSAGALAGEFRVDATGLYQISLRQTGSAELQPGSPDYLIEVLDDAAPRVTFEKPGRDINVTSIDEVFVEATAVDDYGVRTLDLYYSVNGGPEQQVRLFGARPLPEVSAGHTFYLDEYELQAGDFISYYARTEDVGPGRRQPVTSDIYFIEIRPFSRDYRQADEGGQMGGQQGGGMQGEEDGQLSQRQRELISATFNVLRDRGEYSDQEYREHVGAIGQAQAQLRERTESLAGRIAARGFSDESLQQLVTMLRRAIPEMQTAIERLREVDAEEALPAEQRSLMFLQRAEAAFRDVQVSMRNQEGGGGGANSRGSNSPEDLSDLFELEASRLRNQYETVQRGERQQQQAEVDETLDRIRDLARRLQREDQRLREAMANQQMRDGGSAAAQRRMADEAEAEARRLERLARQQSRPELAEAAQRLQEAATSLRRSAADGRSGNSGEARSALEGLEEARRRLERNRATNQREAASDVARRARRLTDEQREINREMNELGGTFGEERMDRTRRLLDRKDDQASEVAQIQRELDRLAGETRADQPGASRRLQAAAESIRQSQLQERIRASRAAAQPNAPEEYRRFVESEIAAGLEQLRSLTEQAAGSFTEPASDRTRDGLDRARNLVRGLESMQERMRQANEEQQQAARGRGEASERGEGRRLQDRQEGQPGQGRGGEGSEERAEGGQGGQEGDPQQEGGGGGGVATADSRIGGGDDRSGAGGGGPRGFRSDDVRQFRGEIRARLQEARQLRQELVREGIDVRELDRAIGQLDALDDDRRYTNPDELQRHYGSILDGLKDFEFALRQQVRAEEARRLFLSGARGVPAEFQELVEQYYRELSEGRR